MKINAANAAVAAILAAIAESRIKRSPWDRGKGHRAKRHLIDPRYRAHVTAQLKHGGLWPNGYYEVRRDGVLTHLIVSNGREWFVRRAARHGLGHANGTSLGALTPQKAAAGYKLIVDKWGHSA